MDDTIVIAENIATRLREGRGAMSAAIEGTKQVAPGVVASLFSVFADLRMTSAAKTREEDVTFSKQPPTPDMS